jgi:hypothetical protein
VLEFSRDVQDVSCANAGGDNAADNFRFAQHGFFRWLHAEQLRVHCNQLALINAKPTAMVIMPTVL